MHELSRDDPRIQFTDRRLPASLIEEHWGLQMKTDERGFTVSAISLAVRSALAVMFVAPLVAHAQDAGNDDLNALIFPFNYFEVGVLNVPTDSTKFGEYNGLNSSGAYFIGNFDVRGGDAYGQGTGTTRWEATGTDLGTTSRNVDASVSDQGLWHLGFSYDELRHYTTEGFQTPFLGPLGGNVFTLSPGFGVINTTTTATNGVITSANKGTQSLTPNQLAAFHNEDVYSQRENTGISLEWGVKFDYKRLDQSGAKLIGSGTDAYNLSSAGGFNYGGERVAMLMNPTEYNNDTFNLALNWTGKQAYASAAYYGSLFHDDFAGISWSNPFVSGGTGSAPVPAPGTSPGAAFPISTMSTPPNNYFHQINLTGGYIFSPSTKLVGGLSYGRNTQNASYAGTYTATPNTAADLPVSSLDGTVVTEHADLKLTHQATQALSFAAGFKYNERDNKTASNTYTFIDLGGEENTAVNIPMSNKRYQFDLGGDWHIDSRQKLHLGYEYDHIERWCNNALANNAQGELSTVNAGYYTVASCVQIPKNTENRLVATYKLKLSDRVDFNAGYTYGRREADVNASFYNPMQANSAGFENFGFRAFFDASRKQNLFKAGVNWQATEKFTVGLNGRHTKDDYFDSTLGVQDGESSSANVDANFSYSEDGSVGAYVSWQKRARNLLTATGRNAVAPLSTLWSNDLADRDNTFGANAKQKGLLSGKLELSEDFNYSLSKSKYITTLGPNIPATLSNQGETPNVSSELTQFKLAGTYQFNRSSSVIAGYLYQRLKSNDYYYNAYLYGFTPTSMLPTNQRAPDYSVNTVFVAYRYSFR
jgi:MtrB/PioB family decaheme-associated outer membrane protein